MPKLTLQFEGRLLKEYAVGVGLTIGRLPDNSVIIDNPAVSGHHARLFSESGAVILEDLDSTNGTFVNGKPTTRQVLRTGDVLLIGKHQLVFEHTMEWSAPPPALPALGDTVYLDTKQHRALRATLEDARAQANARQAQKTPAAPRRVGVLQVIAGRSEQTEYRSQRSHVDHREIQFGPRASPRLVQAVGRGGDRAQQRRICRHADGRPDHDQQRAARAASGAPGRRRAERQWARTGVPLEGRHRDRVGRLEPSFSSFPPTPRTRDSAGLRRASAPPRTFGTFAPSHPRTLAPSHHPCSAPPFATLLTVRGD